MIKNFNYDSEISKWLQGFKNGDSVGILEWFDESKKVSIHDGVFRYDQPVSLGSVKNHED